MSIYILDNEFTNQLNSQLKQVVTSRKVCSIFAMLSGTSESIVNQYGMTENYFKVLTVSSLSTPPTGYLGASLVQKLAKDYMHRIFIKGVTRNTRINAKQMNGSRFTESELISNHDGGFTLGDYYPDIHIFIDCSEGHNQYTMNSINHGAKRITPYVRLYHELLHAEGIIERKPHSHSELIPKVNEFRKQRDFGYQRVVP